MRVKRIAVLQSIDDTPWSYRDNPGILEGPWKSVESAIQELEGEGIDTVQYWDHNPELLWITTKEES